MHAAGCKRWFYVVRHTVTHQISAAYKVGDIDFSSQVAKMKAANVDLILAGTVVRETVGVMAEVRKLNARDRRKDKPTNVLSYPSGEKAFSTRVPSGVTAAGRGRAGISDTDARHPP